MANDPLSFALNILCNTRYNTRTYVEGLLCNVNHVDEAMGLIREQVLHSGSSRRITYREIINNNLFTHEIYTTRHTINALQWIAFTRFRVSAHSLAVETGRWSRRGRPRLPLEERVCQCGCIQTEEHVVVHCPLSAHVRLLYNVTSVHDLFSDKFTNALSCMIIATILDLYN